VRKVNRLAFRSIHQSWLWWPAWLGGLLGRISPLLDAWI